MRINILLRVAAHHGADLQPALKMKAKRELSQMNLCVNLTHVTAYKGLSKYLKKKKKTAAV